MDVSVYFENRRAYGIGPEQWVERFGREPKTVKVAAIKEPLAQEEERGPNGPWLKFLLSIQGVKEKVLLSRAALEEISLFYGNESQDWSGMPLVITIVEWADKEGNEKVRFAFSV